jgi:hypothetical protein
MDTMTDQATTNTDEQIIGLPDQRYCLTPNELRAMADAVEKVEAMNPESDVTLTIKVDGLPYRLTIGWDDTGSVGVLAAWMVDE